VGRVGAVEDVIMFVLVMFITIMTLFVFLVMHKILFGSDVVVINIVFKQKYYPLATQHALLALLRTTDRETGKSFRDLFAIACETKSKNVVVNGKTVNLDREVTRVMEVLLPRKYFKLRFCDIEISNKAEFKPSDFASTEILSENLRKGMVLLETG